MRILHAVHSYISEQIAGVEVYTHRLARRQAGKNSVGVLFARFDPSRVNGSIVSERNLGIDTYSLAQNRFHTRFEHTFLDPKMAHGIAEALDDFQPDIIHIQHLLNLGLDLVREAKRRHIALVMTLHDHWFACANGGQRFRSNRTRCDDLNASRCARCVNALVGPAIVLRGVRQRQRAGTDGRLSNSPQPQRKSIGTAIEQRLHPAWTRLASVGGVHRIESRWKKMRDLETTVDSFLTPSADMLEAAVDFGFSRDSLTLMAHGLPGPDTPFSSRPRHSATRFGYVGSLVPHKGVHDLIQAFNTLPLDVTLDVYGSLTDAPGYVDELRDLSVHPGIRFLGEGAPEKMLMVIREFDCLVAPSIWRENAPFTVQEAFVAGTPVVASNLGGHKELLDAGGGLLFEAGNVEDLGEKLLRFVTEEGLSSRLASTIPRTTSMNDHVEELMAHYQEVLARSDSPSP